MLERLKPGQQPRGMIIVAVFTTLQGVSFLLFMSLIVVLARISIEQAIAKQKPTAASLSTGFAIIGGGFFLAAGIFAFMLAWGLLKQKRWAFLLTGMLEAFSLVMCLLVLFINLNWLFMAEGTLAAVILLCLVVHRDALRVWHP